jgi:hypothetical protein
MTSNPQKISADRQAIIDQFHKKKPKPGYDYVPAVEPEKTTVAFLGNKWGDDENVQGGRTRAQKKAAKVMAAAVVGNAEGNTGLDQPAEGGDQPSVPQQTSLDRSGKTDGDRPENNLDQPKEGGDRLGGLDRPEKGGDRSVENNNDPQNKEDVNEPQDEEGNNSQNEDYGSPDEGEDADTGDNNVGEDADTGGNDKVDTVIRLCALSPKPDPSDAEVEGMLGGQKSPKRRTSKDADGWNTVMGGNQSDPTVPSEPINVASATRWNHSLMEKFQATEDAKLDNNEEEPEIIINDTSNEKPNESDGEKKGRRKKKSKEGNHDDAIKKLSKRGNSHKRDTSPGRQMEEVSINYGTGRGMPAGIAESLTMSLARRAKEERERKAKEKARAEKAKAKLEPENPDLNKTLLNFTPMNSPTGMKGSQAVGLPNQGMTYVMTQAPTMTPADTRQ